MNFVYSWFGVFLGLCWFEVGNRSGRFVLILIVYFQFLNIIDPWVWRLDVVILKLLICPKRWYVLVTAGIAIDIGSIVDGRIRVVGEMLRYWLEWHLN